MKRLELLALLSLAAPLAAVAGNYNLSWSSIDAGGGRSIGGGFVVTGSIAQSDAGEMAAADIRLTGGFWYRTPPMDCDTSESVGLFDFAGFTECVTGPTGTVSEECRCFDPDNSGTVDLIDFGLLQRNFGR